MAFDNVEPGNGFDARRRVAVPIGPKSEAQLHRMHKEVHGQSASRRLGDVMSEFDQWEFKLNKYYRCGGATMPNGTKAIIAMGMLPMSTNPSVRPA